MLCKIKFLSILTSLMLFFFISTSFGMDEENDLPSRSVKTTIPSTTNSLENELRPLVQPSKTDSFASYAESIVNTSKPRYFAKFGTFTFIGLPASSWVFFLTKDFVDNLTGVQGLGYLAGPMPLVPMAYIIYDNTDDKISNIIQALNPSWNQIKRKNSKKDNCLHFTGDGITWSLGIVASSMSLYYTHKYWYPLIGQGSWAFYVPTLIGQSILGSTALKKLGNFLYTESDQYCFKKSWSADKTKKVFVQNKLTSIANSLKNISPDEVNKALDNIRQKTIFDVLQSVDSQEEGCQKFAVSGASLTGSLIGIIGSYAIIGATEVATNWLLQGMGVDPTTSFYTSKALGICGGVTIAAFRGFGSKSTFKDWYMYFSRFCKPAPRPLSKGQVVTDFVSGGFSVISTTARIKIVLDTNISNPVLRDVVIVCSIIGTAATDFFGWKGLFDSSVHGLGSRQTLIKTILKLSNEISNMDDETVDILHTHFSNNSLKQ